MAAALGLLGECVHDPQHPWQRLARDLVQIRAAAELPRHRVVLAEAGRDRHGFRTELVAGLTVQELDLEAGVRPGDGETLAGGDLPCRCAA